MRNAPRVTKREGKSCSQLVMLTSLEELGKSSVGTAPRFNLLSVGELKLSTAK